MNVFREILLQNRREPHIPLAQLVQFVGALQRIANAQPVKRRGNIYSAGKAAASPATFFCSEFTRISVSSDNLLRCAGRAAGTRF
jgi:hypothetical protein